MVDRVPMLPSPYARHSLHGDASGVGGGFFAYGQCRTVVGLRAAALRVYQLGGVP